MFGADPTPEVVAFRNAVDAKAKKILKFSKIAREVGYAKAAQAKDLVEKQARLASLLDTEKRLYESEFQLLVNQRIQTDMQERTNALLARKSERDRIVSQRKADRRNQEPFEFGANEAPTLLSKQLLIESKRDQLLQIDQRRTLMSMDQDDERMWTNISRLRRVKDDQLACRNAHAKSEHNMCVRSILEQQIARRAQLDSVARSDCTASGMFAYRTETDETRRQRRTKCQQTAAVWRSQAEEKLRHERAERRADDEHQLETLRAIDLRADGLRSHQRMVDNRREARQYLDFLAAQREEESRNESRRMECPPRRNGDGDCLEITQKWLDEKQKWSTDLRKQIDANRCQRSKEEQDSAAEAIVERELQLRGELATVAVRK